jgi:hypothetical protein
VTWIIELLVIAVVGGPSSRGAFVAPSPSSSSTPREQRAVDRRLSFRERFNTLIGWCSCWS